MARGKAAKPNKIVDGNTRLRVTLLFGRQGGKNVLVANRNRSVAIAGSGSKDYGISDQVVEHSTVPRVHFPQDAYADAVEVIVLFGCDCDEQAGK